MDKNISVMSNLHKLNLSSVLNPDVPSGSNLVQAIPPDPPPQPAVSKQLSEAIQRRVADFRLSRRDLAVRTAESLALIEREIAESERKIQALTPRRDHLASIAAELFMYFNPDICVAGYESTLYQNIGDVEQDVALFRRTYETAMETTNLAFYADKMDIFIADMNDTEDTFTFAGNEKALKMLEAALKAVPEDEAGDRNYLVEFNNADRQVNEYDYAIWNASKGVIRYLAGNVEEGLSPVE